MPDLAIRNAIKTAMETVADVGVVHNRVRFAATWDKIMEYYKTTVDNVEQIRGWNITLRDAPTVIHAFNNRRLRQYTHIIRLYLGVDDSRSTDIKGGQLCEAVMDALDESALHGTGYYEAEPATLEIYEMRTFGGILCHYAEILQQVTEFKAES